MYNRTYWLNHITDPNNCFKIIDNKDGTVSLVRAGTILQQGTYQDQDHFNQIEEMLFALAVSTGVILNHTRQNAWTIESEIDKNTISLTNINELLSALDISTRLLLNHTRQNAWEIEKGSITLTNSEMFPFNNSQKTIVLKKARENDYIVVCDVTSFAGNVGEIVVTDRLVNGFKLGYTGSAKSVSINYQVIGGLMK